MATPLYSDAPGVNHGAYICAGARVVVREEHGDWFGHVLGISLMPDGQAEVKVKDPCDNPFRWLGQRVVCSYRQLGAVPR